MRDTIIISPFASRIKAETQDKHPKNYKYIDDLVQLLRYDFDVIQVGVDGERILKYAHRVEFNRSFDDLSEMVNSCKSWVSVDSFFPHLVNYYYNNTKPGLVLFSVSDPLIFGYPYNLNIVNRKCLRPDQYGLWGEDLYRDDAFYPARYVFTEFNKFLSERF